MNRYPAFAGLAAALLFSTPVLADTVQGRDIRVVQQEVSPEARSLAARVFVLTAPDLEKKITEYMSQLLSTTGLADVDPDAAAWFEKNATPLLMPHLRALISEMEVRYAEVLTLQELQALVDFYDNPMGRSIAAKMLDLGLEMEEPIARMSEAYLADLLAAYCTANDCAKATQPAAKPTRR